MEVAALSAFADCFEKTAEKDSSGRALLKGLVASNALRVGTLAAGLPLYLRAHAVVNDPKVAITKEQAARLQEAMLGDIPEHVRPEVTTGNRPRYNFFGKGKVTLPEKLHPGVAAHELGHAAGHHSKGPLAYFLHGRGPHFARAALPLAGVAAASLSDPNSATSKYVAPALSGTWAVSNIAREADASRRGLAALARLGLSPEDLLRSRKDLRYGLATHGLRGASAIAAPILVRLVKKHLEDE